MSTPRELVDLARREGAPGAWPLGVHYKPILLDLADALEEALDGVGIVEEPGTVYEHPDSPGIRAAVLVDADDSERPWLGTPAAATDLGKGSPWLTTGDIKTLVRDHGYRIRES